MIPDGGPAQVAPIAIVGMGCRVPGGISSPRALWEVLENNRDVLGEVPPHRWESYASRGPDFAKAVRRAVSTGGYLDDIDGFDADFFGPRARMASSCSPLATTRRRADRL